MTPREHSSQHRSKADRLADEVGDLLGPDGDVARFDRDKLRELLTDVCTCEDLTYGLLATPNGIALLIVHDDGCPAKEPQ